LTSYSLLQGLDWLDLQQVASQLTSLTLNYGVIIPDAYPDRQGNIQLLADLAQLSELRHLDIGNCQIAPADGALVNSVASYALYCCQAAQLQNVHLQLQK
jgi:hypothetical protein